MRISTTQNALKKQRFTTATIYQNRIYKSNARFINAATVIAAFVNALLIPIKIIQKHIRMRLFTIAAFINGIYECDYLPAFLYLRFKTTCRTKTAI